MPQLPGHRDLAPLGRGGYSEVYRAYQEQFDRWVAVKVLTFTLTDERSQRRFLRECRLAGRLSSHPNIVTVYDAGITPDGRPYIAMELFPEGSISDALRGRGPFDVAEALRTGIALAGALETAHRAGVVHRDVKPANVLLTSYRQPVLTDFGLSIVSEHHEVSVGSDALTPYHAAPEVLERTSIAPTSDVYSLASTVYAMLAGRAAHQGETQDSIASLLLRILQQDVPPLSRSDLPPSLPGTLQLALARDPGVRTPSALAFALALQDAQRELGGEVTEPVLMDIPASSVEAPFGPPGLSPSPSPGSRSATPSGSPPGGSPDDPPSGETPQPWSLAPAPLWSPASRPSSRSPGAAADPAAPGPSPGPDSAPGGTPGTPTPEAPSSPPPGPDPAAAPPSSGPVGDDRSTSAPGAASGPAPEGGALASPPGSPPAGDDAGTGADGAPSRPASVGPDASGPAWPTPATAGPAGAPPGTRAPEAASGRAAAGGEPGGAGAPGPGPLPPDPGSVASPAAGWGPSEAGPAGADVTVQRGRLPGTAPVDVGAPPASPEAGTSGSDRSWLPAAPAGPAAGVGAPAAPATIGPPEIGGVGAPGQGPFGAVVDEDRTVHRAQLPTVSRPAPLRVPDVERSRWATVALVGGTLLGVGALAGGAVLLVGGDDERGDRRDRREEARAEVDVPQGLEVAESQAGVQLDWQGEEDEAYVVLVLSEDEPPILVSADGPSALIPSTDLRPDLGYCFAVARARDVSDAPSGQAEEAFTSPTCIRGAAEDTVIQE